MDVHQMCIDLKRYHVNANELDWMLIQCALGNPCECTSRALKEVLCQNSH